MLAKSLDAMGRRVLTLNEQSAGCPEPRVRWQAVRVDLWPATIQRLAPTLRSPLGYAQ